MDTDFEKCLNNFMCITKQSLSASYLNSKFYDFDGKTLLLKKESDDCYATRIHVPGLKKEIKIKMVNGKVKARYTGGFLLNFDFTDELISLPPLIRLFCYDFAHRILAHIIMDEPDTKCELSLIHI